MSVTGGPLTSTDELDCMLHLEGVPEFAVEVRSEGDYGAGGEAKRARKREDYFTAGTKVVSDVDLLGNDAVRVYRADRPRDTPAVFHRGDVADADAAVPGWSVAGDALFDRASSD